MASRMFPGECSASLSSVWLAFIESSSKAGGKAPRVTPHPLEYRFIVPDSYYDDCRDWYGRVYKDATWTCFEYGQLLVVGPGQQFDPVWKLTGFPVLFCNPSGSSKKRRYGEWSNVYTPYNRELEVKTSRLVPVELCEYATPEEWFLQGKRLVKS